MLEKLQYQAGHLRGLLNNLLSKNTSGFVHIKTIVNSEQKLRFRFLVLKKGEIVYGGAKIPNNQEFVRTLGIKLSPKWADTVVRYATQKLKNPSSFRELLEHIIRIRVFKWEQIEAAVHAQVVQVLEQTLPYRGQLELDSEEQIDLSYGTDCHGLDWYKLLQDVASRQVQWAALTPVVPNMEAVPRLLQSGRRAVKDSVVQQHLHEWVDGKRSLIEIAEQLEQDPLQLARSYVVWAASDSVTLKEDAPVSQIFPAVEEQLPMVLSVDDSSMVQILIKRALNDHYQVFFASNAVLALRLMSTNLISLLLLDVTMPGIDGIEFCRTVRSIPKFKELPIIMVTARDKFSDKLRGQIAGSTHYLIKPFEPKFLLEIVDKYVGVKQTFKSGSSEYSFRASGVQNQTTSAKSFPQRIIL